METTEDIMDIEEEWQDDATINLNVMLKNALQLAARTLAAGAKDNFTNTILSYSTLIEYAETMAKARRYVQDDYDDKINEFRDSKEFKNIDNKSIQIAKLANKKLALITQGIQQGQPIDTSIKM